MLGPAFWAAIAMGGTTVEKVIEVELEWCKGNKAQQSRYLVLRDYAVEAGNADVVKQAFFSPAERVDRFWR